MSYKPGDFFLGDIGFFGILVPGAILMYLHGDRLLAWLGEQPILDSQVGRWISFLIGVLSPVDSLRCPPWRVLGGRTRKQSGLHRKNA